MLLAAMLAMVLVAAAPAFAQQDQAAASVYGDIQQQQIQCVQTAVQDSDQFNQYGDNVNIQAIAQECNISVTQAQEIVNLLVSEGVVVEEAAEGEAAAAVPGGVLPDTGGASLFALGAGALLVAGGLLARRIIR